MKESESRLEAMSLGQNKYQGSPCMRGHTGIRFVKGSHCIECQADRVLSEKDKESKRAYDRKHYALGIKRKANKNANVET